MKLHIAVCGVEGAGKTTTVKAIQEILADAGCSTRRVSFMALPFNHLTSPHRWMARSAKKAAGFREGVPMANYDDKLRALLDVKPSRVSPLYVLVFLFRVALFRILFMFQRHDGAEITIFERYFYDNVVSKTTRSRLDQFMESVMLAATPQPTLVFLLQADVDDLIARRPRVSRESVRAGQARYATLTQRIPAVTIDTSCDASPIEPVLKRHLVKCLHVDPRESRTGYQPL